MGNAQAQPAGATGTPWCRQNTFKGEDRSEMRFYNRFTAAEISGAYGLKKLDMENVKPIVTTGHLGGSTIDLVN